MTLEMKPKLKLSDEDGNVFSIIGRGLRVLRENGATQEQLTEFREEVTSGDYDHALQTCFKWFDVE